MMAGSIYMKLAALIFATTWIYCSTDAKKSKVPVDRSYQLSPVAVVNGAQGIQYYATGPAFPAAVPAVLATPAQIGVSANNAPAIPGFILPASVLKPVPQEYYQASPPPTPQNTYQSSMNQPFHHDNSQYHNPHRPKIRSYPPISYKRPGTYINSVHHHPSGPKHTIGLSGYMNHKTAYSVQSSVDLTENQPAPPSFLSTVAPPSASTYGPPKPVEFQHKHRPTGSGPLYHRHKGHPHTHRISLYSPKPMRIYSHYHNGHIHNHYVPAHSTPLYKSQLYSPKPTSPTFIKPSSPPYLPPSSETPSTGFAAFPQENPYKSQEYSKPHHNYHAHPQTEPPNAFASNNIRFPDSFETIKNSNNFYSNHQTVNQGLSEASRPHEELTQAIIKEPGVINNHDASLPLKIPTQKPNHFAVNEILKNADIHYVDGNERPQHTEQSDSHENHRPAQTTYSTSSESVQQTYPDFQFQGPQYFDPSQQAFQTYAIEQMNPENHPPSYASNHQGVSNQIEFYDPRINPVDYPSNVYQTNYLQNEHELGTSETLKIPVAIFRGIQNTNGQGMFALALKRSDDKVTENFNTDSKPGKISSDWVPMSNGNIKSSALRAEKLQSAEPAEAVTYGKLEPFGDQFFAGLTTKNRDKKDNLKQIYTETTPIITSNRDIGDIISGKIPNEYAPFKTNSHEKISNIRTIDTKNGRDSDIVTSKISFDNSPSSDRRKGSVVDDYTGLSPESFKFGDTSNLVVSSVIKFS